MASQPAANGAASVTVADAASSSSAAAARDPNFSGDWRSLRHENLPALLIAQGFSAANAERANAATVTQRITHSRRLLTVEVGGMLTSYAITGGWIDEETDEETMAAADAEQKESDLSEAMLQKTAEWMGTVHRRLVSSTGDLDTSRAISNEDPDLMIVQSTAHVEDKEDIVATTTFRRVQPAAAAASVVASTV